MSAPAYYYRPEDGHTYFRQWGIWFGAPTFKDGSPDLECAGPVEDFDIEPEDLAELTIRLDARHRARRWWARSVIALEARTTYRKLRALGYERHPCRDTALQVIAIRLSVLKMEGLT